MRWKADHRILQHLVTQISRVKFELSSKFCQQILKNFNFLSIFFCNISVIE